MGNFPATARRTFPASAASDLAAAYPCPYYLEVSKVGWKGGRNTHHTSFTRVQSEAQASVNVSAIRLLFHKDGYGAPL